MKLEGATLLIIDQQKLAQLIEEAVANAIKPFMALIKDPEPEDKLLTVEETAVFLNLKPGYVREMNCRSQLPSPKKLGRRVYFKKSILQEWNDKGRPPIDKSVNQGVDELLKSVTRKKRK